MRGKQGRGNKDSLPSQVADSLRTCVHPKVLSAAPSTRPAPQTAARGCVPAAALQKRRRQRRQRRLAQGGERLQLPWCCRVGGYAAAMQHRAGCPPAPPGSPAALRASARGCERLLQRLISERGHTQRDMHCRHGRCSSAASRSALPPLSGGSSSAHELPWRLGGRFDRGTGTCGDHPAA